MLLKTQCPSCGRGKEYIAEQVGHTGYCDGCGHAFTLRGQPLRAVWQLTVATVVVVVAVTGAIAKVYRKAHRHDHARANPPAFSTSAHEADGDE